MASHQLVKFGDLMYCGIENLMTFDCHLNLQDHVIKGLCDFMG